MGRTDGFGRELLPDCRVIQRIIDRLRGKVDLVQIGSGRCLFGFEGINYDLANKTTVKQLIDVATVADAFIGYVSFLVPLAESLNKPAFFVWSRKGLKSREKFISRVTPQKVLEKPSSKWVTDDCLNPESILDGFL
jgi:ADP-heptose:LPS heptosyltransferase